MKMITKQNFKSLLLKLGFIENGNLFTKTFSDFSLSVDFKNETLTYPKELKVNDKTTSNFSHPENFVVFECVHRLLEKGYMPKHIELEPKWSLGHLKKSGKADIGIKDNDGKNLVIIECKTAGSEYQKALGLTKRDGGQIFSYAANSGCEYIALYASDEEANFEYFLISLKDNEQLLHNKKGLKSYKEARGGVYGDTAKALFGVWSETYVQESVKGLFEKSVRVYELQKEKFSIDDLKTVGESDIKKIYHRFATILRQHNVSSHENAFDKLVNLFLCKIVDEIKNKEELQFYYKGRAIDDEFSFSDRLQKLYKEGMKEFLNEDITYIDNSEIEAYFKLFDAKTVKSKVTEAINKLKFFTSNDFAFIDVHNEKLFYQNFEVLLKIVLLFQDISLTNSEENQFLGDLFEGFLDQGIKQNEGQYFTPMPIVKFIISSLPKKEYASMCDYACGAGHFLNEFAVRHKEAEIVGIEKEYRLSKVSKVSSFMYGSKNVTLIYEDALKKDVTDKKFQTLISNPPYSVKGFLETLSQEDLQTFELAEYVDVKSYGTNNSIECFFIEKTKHLLQSGGIAAIIVPISVLDKTNSKLFVKTREVLLKYFDIKAIVKLPTNTFGKTGTTTIVLYLQKRDEKEDIAGNVVDIVAQIYQNGFSLLESFKYKELFEAFLEYMEYDKQGYRDFIKGKYNKKLFGNEIFKSYLNDFKKSLKQKDKKQGYKKLKQRFLEQTKEREKERFIFFMLAFLNGDVTVVLPPSKNNEIKKFLGYEWSSAKGNEGIKYLSDTTLIESDLDEDEARTLSNITTINNIQTPLYNPNDDEDSSKISFYIRRALEGKTGEVDAAVKNYIKRFAIVDMLDIKEVEFSKVINLNIKKEVEIKSKWKLVRLEDIADDIIAGQSPKSIYYNDKEIGLAFFQGKKEFGDLYLQAPTTWVSKPTKISYKNDILISVRAPVGDVNLNPFDKICIGRGLGAIRIADKVTRKYIFYFLSIFKENIPKKEGSSFESLPISNLKNMKIPIPTKKIQQNIIDECKEVEALYKKSLDEKEKLKKGILQKWL